MPVMPKHHVVRLGVGLDAVVFERNAEETVFVTLKTKKPARENVQSLMHVLADLVLGDSIGKEMGNIATCQLPLVGNNITLPPGVIRWKALKRMDSVFSFRISIVDERGGLLAYKGGKCSIVILIRPKR